MGLGSDQAFRKSVIGASEIAALYGVSPWKTHFQLWHEKNGTLEPEEFATTEFQQAGVFLEPSIIEWACHKWGYKKEFTPKNISDEPGEAAMLGGHPDQMVRCPTRGLGVLEIKTVDRLIYKKWGDEPPLQYQLQAMAYAGLTGADFADIIALVGGNELVRLSDDQRVQGAVQAYLAAAEIAKDQDAIKKRAQAEISHLIGLEAKSGGDAIKKVVATVPGFQVTSTLIEGKPDRAAEPGEIIKGRKPHRRLYFKELDE